jgi:hypothetical protein
MSNNNDSKPRINSYDCPRGHSTVTIDVDEGVTPMFLNCRTVNCGLQARSSFYHVPVGLKPEFEWYKPTDIKKLNPAEKEHVNKGGLLIRKIKA